MPDVHARLSASGAKRWMSCTPSASLESQFKDESSVYAEEGTFAHSMAELKINYLLGNITKAVHTRSLNKLKKNEYYSEGLESYVDEYVAKVFEFINEYREAGEVEVLTEQRLDFSDYVPEGFGTGDVIVITDDAIHVMDLKYGKGVAVDAKDNPQLRLYGLGAIQTFGMLYDFTKVKTSILQPRLEYYTTEELTVDEIQKWGNEVVKPLAELAMAGEGELNAGDHCKFCKARATCRARAEKNLELAKYEFMKGELLEPEEIADILTRQAELVSWAKDITDYALKQAVDHGVKYPGFKLVEGRSNRKYSDDTEVINALKEAGYEEEMLFERKLYGITAMEKIIGKKKFNEIAGSLIIKPEGKPTLVPESDKRKAINSTDKAADDFKETP